jgi:hypothetical protein
VFVGGTAGEAGPTTAGLIDTTDGKTMAEAMMRVVPATA